MKECPKNEQDGGNLGNRAQFSSVALVEEQIAFMQSRVSKRKRTLQMFSLV